MSLKKLSKNRIVFAIITVIIKSYIRLLFLTCKLDIRFDKQAKELIGNQKICLLPCWHSRILIFPYFMSTLGKFAAVISAHGDGEVLNHVVCSYGHKSIRGSSRKQSVKAMIGLIKTIKEGVSVVITPDGPMGPKFKVKGNISDLALKYKLPIIMLSYSASYAIVLKTWDRFIIPLPFVSKIIIDISEPMHISSKHKINGNQILQKEMLKQTKRLDQSLGLKIDY